MNKKQTRSTFKSNYSEAAALQDLLVAIDESVRAIDIAFETNADDTSEEFFITINGKQIAFIVGGPQIEALHAFVQHIVDDNCYEVDYYNSTVTE